MTAETMLQNENLGDPIKGVPQTKITDINNRTSVDVSGILDINELSKIVSFSRSEDARREAGEKILKTFEKGEYYDFDEEWGKILRTRSIPYLKYLFTIAENVESLKGEADEILLMLLENYKIFPNLNLNLIEEKSDNPAILKKVRDIKAEKEKIMAQFPKQQEWDC